MNAPAESTRSTPQSKARLRLWLRLLGVTRKIENELRDKLRREHDTTLPRFDVMSALHRHPDGLRMSELSGVLKVSNGNVTGIVDRLTEEGLVERVAVPGDRRAMMARLTERGQTVFIGQAAEHEAWIDGLFAEMDADEARIFANRLGELAELLETRGETQ
ncbi:MarR family transcriptional regulator [Lutimaribacter sp. EGI FJ00015]|uniref:MarR family transcriptional regulator n=1 Tax=Lutimaribacter degradans TaxID=2945989 RepID=A0ACC6A0Y8_9RHOB|nr:MarR family transcriptional regulator [Lutimaribacter sp. EGI FJ00013]MCM2563279.1 MarR family transcriptional regulator [Lutimaribacter sp. EGI FJ00013]MCO0614398.1 MarR family transcriptional regulator [Lutimaribacter sp. EGI FJ00015]MCO0636001.1 MarR family transcriptional regulator [Lutimaribacter sp. EGI FJ00014]